MKGREGKLGVLKYEGRKYGWWEMDTRKNNGKKTTLKNILKIRRTGKGEKNPSLFSLELDIFVWFSC